MRRAKKAFDNLWQLFLEFLCFPVRPGFTALINSVSVVDASLTNDGGDAKPATNGVVTTGAKAEGKTHADQVATASPELLALWEQFTSYVHSLGDDIQQKQLKLYVAFARIKNFLCASLVSKHDPRIWLILKIDPGTVKLEDGFSRDVRQIGHWGTGDLELNIRNAIDLEKAKSLIERCYQEN